MGKSFACAVKKDLNSSASTDLKASLNGTGYVIVSTPTNYHETTSFFDTSLVEAVIAQVIESETTARMVVESTIPVGFMNDLRERLTTGAVMFSQELLREGKALHDNFYPGRSIVSKRSERATTFANLLADGELKAEAI